MKIKDVLCSPGRTGFFFDDQKAIKQNAVMDGAAYFGAAATPGFTSVRQAGESISVMFILEDGQVAYGDCAAVQYSGAGGRDPLFLAGDFIKVIEREIVPLFKGREITTFREMAALADSHVGADTGKPLHTAIRYGVTQAVLDAVAKAGRKLMAQIVAGEYGLSVSDRLIPIFSQTGDDRYTNADKMIMRQSDVLPHGLFNNMEKIGAKGERLAEYTAWLRDRIIRLRTDESYSPVIHIDVYGNLGPAFGYDFRRIADYAGGLAETAAPFLIRIEGPVDMGGREAQIAALSDIRALVDKGGSNARIVADEWCNTFEDVVEFTNAKAGHMAQVKTPDLGGVNNTIEAVLYCKEHGMGAYQGGTCNETDRSARVCAQIAMAAKPDQILAKPGMGVDEGYMIVYNEMQRVLALKDAL